MRKLILFITSLLFFIVAKAKNIELKYHLSNAEKVELLWGINDWQSVKQQPVGTVLRNKVMVSPMRKSGDYFMILLNVPEGAIIDYAFVITKKEGPFKIPIEYWGLNGWAEKKFYHAKADDGNITIEPDVHFFDRKASYTFQQYALFLFIPLYLIAIVTFFTTRYFFRKQNAGFSQTIFFGTIALSFITSLFFIRIYTTQLLIAFLLNPVKTSPILIKVFSSDFIYSFILTSLMAIAFFLLKRIRKTILITFAVLAVLTVIAALLNAKLINTTGKPFNLQWLYYSDFLKSNDAANAMLANVDKDFVYGSILMLLALLPLSYIFYKLWYSKPLAIPTVLLLMLIFGWFSKAPVKVPKLSTVNPISYFIHSCFQSSDLSIFNDKSLASYSQLNIKNPNLTIPYYDSLFKQHSIKNIIVVVMESTPAEYITAFNPSIKATPFLDSIKNSAALFDAVYAHAPATNKSMASFLCASYLNVSFQSITAELPGLKLPSAPSELKKYGYRSAFFNAGDNKYQNAEGFLKAREFDLVADFMYNRVDSTSFSDKRFMDNADGTDDKHLQENLFKWIAEDRSKPFFAMMWTFQTHYPYYFKGKQTNYGTSNPSLERYLNALHHADETIHAIVDELQRKKLMDSTLIVVLGDHGEAFGRHNQTTHAGSIYEENIHIPLMLINPVLFKGERIQHTAGISDVLPTIFSVLNKPLPIEWQGENLFSVKRRSKVFFFSPYSDYLFGLRHGHFKFIFNATANYSELYNLNDDPTETTNIANKYPGLVTEYKKDVQAWLQYQDNYMQQFSTKSVRNK